MMDIQQLITKLNLLPHPEGGYFREIYRSPRNINVPEARYQGGVRAESTAIYFLLTSENFSAFHKLKSDELWHFHQGSSLTIHIIQNEGEAKKTVLGDPLENENASPQATILRDTWFAAEVNTPNFYSLVSCTVAPGFDFSDFSLAKKDELVQQYPQHQDLIMRLSRE